MLDKGAETHAVAGYLAPPAGDGSQAFHASGWDSSVPSIHI